MVTKMRGAALFPQEGSSEEMTPAQISQKPPKEVKPKPTDQIADVLPFSKSKTRFRSTQWILLPFFPLRLLASSLLSRTDKVGVPLKAEPTSHQREEDRAGPSSTAQTKGGHLPGDLHCGHRVKCVFAGQMATLHPMRLFLDGPGGGHYHLGHLHHIPPCPKVHNTSCDL